MIIMDLYDFTLNDSTSSFESMKDAIKVKFSNDEKDDDDEKDYFYLMLPTLLVLEVFIFLY